jgi:hypothetical protein
MNSRTPRTLGKLTALTLAIPLLCAGCAYERGYVTTSSPDYEYVSEPPVAPAAPFEVITTSPGPDYVWINGYYDWEGPAPYRHRWVAGHWDRPARPQSAWVNGEWEHNEHGYRWRRGYWR